MPLNEWAFTKEPIGNASGDLGCVFRPLNNETEESFACDVLLFLILKNFLAFSSSSQLLAGDQIRDGLEDNEAIKQVGVLGLIS